MAISFLLGDGCPGLSDLHQAEDKEEA